MITPNPTDTLLVLHAPSVPKAKVVQFPVVTFAFSAPALMPAEFHAATDTKAENQKIYNRERFEVNNYFYFFYQSHTQNKMSREA